MSVDTWKAYKQAILDSFGGDFSPLYKDLKKQKPSTDGWVEASCPFHADKDPSFGYHRPTGRWVCFARCGKGGPIDYVMQTSGMPFKDALQAVGDERRVPRPEVGKKEPPLISEKQVQAWVANLWANEDVVQWLRDKRGLTDETLKKYQIGWDPKRQRNTIPVRDERGNVVNVRLYNAKKKPKIINYTEGKHRYGSPARLFGVRDLAEYDGQQVLLLEGEWDCILARQEGFMAVTGTGGCSTFRPEWTRHFKAKDVVVIYDCDPEGQKAAGSIVRNVLKHAGCASVKNIVLPLGGSKDDKDITDFLHKRSRSAAELHNLIEQTPPHDYTAEDKPEEILDLESFTEVENKKYIDRKIRCEITVCGETSEAFHAVEQFQITYCPRMAKTGCVECRGTCAAETIPKGAQEYIGSCMSTNVQLKAMLREYACKYGQKPNIDILGRTTVKEFFCHQRVNRVSQTRDADGNFVQIIDGKLQELLEKRVYYLSSEHPKPGNYVAVGWVKSHPKTQQVTMLIESLEPMEDDFESFRVQDHLPELRALQRIPIADLIRDIRDHVTQIYQRDEILLAVLLTYCSPLHFRLKSKSRPIRGWLTTAIIGDSGTGKTQSFDHIAEFLGIGDMFSGLTGSRTGLAYALVDHKQKGWQVRVGRYPANSRRLLAVDEVQEIPMGQLKTIAKAMDEGFMQIDRVSSRGYESKTRLLLLGNPKQNALLDEYHYGCITLKVIFPTMLIRRLDLAIFANTHDVDALRLCTEKQQSADAPRVSREALRALVLWAWNLKPEDIEITPDAVDACFELISGLADAFGYATDVPLVTRYETEKLLARLAVAFAVLDVSATSDLQRLIVRPEHMQTAAHFLHSIYSSDNCGLDTYSKICRQQEQLEDYDKIAEKFRTMTARGKHSGEDAGVFRPLVWAIWTSGARRDARRSAIRRRDLADIVGCTPQHVSRVVSLLKRFDLVEATRDGYIIQPKFTRFLRRLLREAPDYFDGMGDGNQFELQDTEGVSPF